MGCSARVVDSAIARPDWQHPQASCQLDIEVQHDIHALWGAILDASPSSCVPCLAAMQNKAYSPGPGLPLTSESDHVMSADGVARDMDEKVRFNAALILQQGRGPGHES